MKGQKNQQVSGLVVALLVLGGIGLFLFLPMVPQNIFVFSGSGHIFQIDDNTFEVRGRTSFVNLDAGSALCLQNRDSSGGSGVAIPFTDPSKVIYDSNVKVTISSSERNVIPAGTYIIPDDKISINGNRFCFSPSGTIPNWDICCPEFQGSVSGSFDASEAVCGNSVCEPPKEDAINCNLDCGAAMPPTPPEPPPPTPTLPPEPPVVDDFTTPLILLVTVIGVVAMLLIAVVIRTRR